MGDISTKFPAKPTPEDCIVFRGWDSTLDDDSQSESGVCSPTLWGSSNSRTSQPRNRSLSPTSRTRAIARGRQELMEMVRSMPESSYELSLKDLVEHHLSSSQRQQDAGGSVERCDSASETSFRRDSSKRRSETRALVTRSRSVDSGGFYLKMFFPLPFGPISSKKKRNLRTDTAALNVCSSVTPKPPPQVDRDWWRKRSSGAAGENEGSVSGGSMTSSGSSNSTSSQRSNSRNSESSQGSCWFCISPIRSKKSE